MTEILRAEHLSKIYKSPFFRINHRGIRDVSFSVNKGEIFGFLGPNGAGKTTTLKIIVGIHRADSGRVFVKNIPINDIEYKKHIGFLPENPYFHNYLSAEEFLSITGALYGLNGKKLRERIKEVLEKVGLTKYELRGKRIKNFSKGMIQRLGIAQAIIHEPEIVILDEPLSGLDPIGRKEVRDVILDLKKEGKTVFFSSHILQDVEMICDRVAIIADGKIIKTGILEEMLVKKDGAYEVKLALKESSSFDVIKKFGEISDIEGNTVFVYVDNEESKDKLLETIVKDGFGKILKVNPLHKSLEDEFMRLFNIEEKNEA